MRSQKHLLRQRRATTCPTDRATVSAPRGVECPRRTAGVWSPCASPTPAPHEPAASPDGRARCSAGLPPYAAHLVPRAATCSWPSGSPMESRVARSRRLSLSVGEAGLCLVGSMLASERSFSTRGHFRLQGNPVLRRAADFLRLLDRRLQRCSGSCRAATSGNPPGHADSTSAQRSSFTAVLRPRPHAPVPAPARACSAARIRNAGLAARDAGAASGDDQIPSSPSTSVRPDPKSSSANRHALDERSRGVPCYQPPCRHSSRRES